MASNTKPIKLYTHKGTPNPLKVQIIMEELGIPYEKADVENPKDESFVNINPNGRLPAIYDPNTDLTLWESGAIVEYLVDTYDKDNKLGVTDPNEKWHLKQYLHFQMSGQGPYWGQLVFFYKFHTEDVPSAKKRYEEQLVRVIEVLNNILEGKQYLVGDKVTYADLAFIPWNGVATYMEDVIWNKYEIAKKYPNFVAWNERISSRPAVKQARANE